MSPTLLYLFFSVTLNEVKGLYLAGAGLNAAMVDVHDREMMKTVYLIKSFRDAVVFSPADIS